MLRSLAKVRLPKHERALTMLSHASSRPCLLRKRSTSPAPHGGQADRRDEGELRPPVFKTVGVRRGRDADELVGGPIRATNAPNVATGRIARRFAQDGRGVPPEFRAQLSAHSPTQLATSENEPYAPAPEAGESPSASSSRANAPASQHHARRSKKHPCSAPKEKPAVRIRTAGPQSDQRS